MHVLSHHSQIIAQTSINSCQIRPNDPQDHEKKLIASTLLFKFPERKQISSREMWHSLQPQPLHCLAMTRLSNSQNLQKVDNDIVVFNGNVLGHAWHTWYKMGTNGKRMSCSLLICHMQIFKLIDSRTMGLWKWNYLPFFDTHCSFLTETDFAADSSGAFNYFFFLPCSPYRHNNELLVMYRQFCLKMAKTSPRKKWVYLQFKSHK